MLWIAPSENDTGNNTLEKRLWDAADQFRANSGLKAGQYSQPALGLIFLRFAEASFATQRAKPEKASLSARRGSRVDDPVAYHADNLLYLTPHACFEHLLTLPESTNVGKAVNSAMAELKLPIPSLTLPDGPPLVLFQNGVDHAQPRP
jgi:type I restriction enzyme M protein